MNSFQSNIISLYGEKGKVWLDALPQLVVSASSNLGLRGLKEVSNLTYNYVLSGFQDDRPIILKFGLDKEGLGQEALTLKCFAGFGAVQVLSEDDLPDEALAKAGGLLLIERAVPGTSLRGVYDEVIQEFSGSRRFACDDEAVKIACGVIKKLHQANIPAAYSLPHIKDWLAALDKNCSIPDEYLQKARTLRDQLLKTTGPDVLLHGDLHHDNILKNGDHWVAIDPKGVIGEAAYEVAAFIRNPMPELLNQADAPNIIHNRITRFAAVLELPSQRIIDWCFVQAVLSWVWALEDSLNTRYFQQLTRIFSKML